MDDYNSNIKDCPFKVNIMGISPKGIIFIGRRYESNMSRDSADGRYVNVARLDPVSGHMIGTMNLVKWKLFTGSFEKRKFNKEQFLNDYKLNRKQMDPIKFVTPTEKKYGFRYPIMAAKAMKKYKISSGVAYRWMALGILEYSMVGKNRYVPREKFAELAENHADKRRIKPKKKASVPAVIPAYVVSPKRWWQFWKNKNN